MSYRITILHNAFFIFCFLSRNRIYILFIEIRRSLLSHKHYAESCFIKLPVSHNISSMPLYTLFIPFSLSLNALVHIYVFATITTLHVFGLGGGVCHLCTQRSLAQRRTQKHKSSSSIVTAIYSCYLTLSWEFPHKPGNTHKSLLEDMRCQGYTPTISGTLSEV